MLRTLDREFEIYERLPQGHPRLVRMYGYHPDKEHDDRGIVLEYLRNGDLRKYFESGADITPEQRFQWALDAADAVRLLHSHEIIHSDIKTSNFLLDDGLRLRIADLSGSIDGKEPRAYETTRFYLPRDLYVPNPSSVRTDLFALGSSLYEIFTGKPPYADIQDDEVDKRYKDGIFPATDDVVCGDIIRGCWIGSIVSADAVHAAVKKQADAHTC
jgi:serine/threonine protein kinase